MVYDLLYTDWRLHPDMDEFHLPLSVQRRGLGLMGLSQESLHNTDTKLPTLLASLDKELVAPGSNSSHCWSKMSRQFVDDSC